MVRRGSPPALRSLVLLREPDFRMHRRYKLVGKLQCRGKVAQVSLPLGLRLVDSDQ